MSSEPSPPQPSMSHLPMSQPQLSPTPIATEHEHASAATVIRNTLGTDPDASPQNKSKRGKRSGAPNYTDEDMSALLDIVEKIEPIGSNEWAAVSSKFEEYTDENDRPKRDIDSLRMKFDRLANTKKPTGSSSCPPLVRRAKNIARDILGRVNAVSVGDDVGELGNGSNGSGDIDTTSDGSGSSGKRRYGSRSRKRKAGAAGIRREDNVDVLVGHVGDMSRAIVSLVEKESGSGESLSSADVHNILKQEMEVVNASIDELKQLMMAHMQKQR